MQRLIGKSETERNKNRLGKQKQKHKQEGKTDCWENRNRKKQRQNRLGNQKQIGNIETETETRRIVKIYILASNSDITSVESFLLET